MLKDPLSDSEFALIHNSCTDNDLQILQNILNEPKAIIEQKQYKTVSHLAHSFKELCAYTYEELASDTPYQEILEFIASKFSLEHSSESPFKTEECLALIFFKIPAVEYSEENVLLAQKKALKLKPDMLASNFNEYMRDQLKGRKSLFGLAILIAGCSVEHVAKKFQTNTFEEITILSYITMLHFIRARTVGTQYRHA